MGSLNMQKQYRRKHAGSTHHFLLRQNRKLTPKWQLFQEARMGATWVLPSVASLTCRSVCRFLSLNFTKRNNFLRYGSPALDAFWVPQGQNKKRDHFSYFYSTLIKMTWSVFLLVYFLAPRGYFLVITWPSVVCFLKFKGLLILFLV